MVAPVRIVLRSNPVAKVPITTRIDRDVWEPEAPTTVRVYVVEAPGAGMVMACPLVRPVPTPWSMLPVPFANAKLNRIAWPAMALICWPLVCVVVVLVAVKVAMLGPGYTVMVFCAVCGVPAAFATVRV